MLRIELLVGLDDAFGRAVARGVVRYAKSRPDWKLYGYDRGYSAFGGRDRGAGSGDSGDKGDNGDRSRGDNGDRSGHGGSGGKGDRSRDSRPRYGEDNDGDRSRHEGDSVDSGDKGDNGDRSRGDNGDGFRYGEDKGDRSRYNRLFADPREIEGAEGLRADGLIARVESAEHAKSLAALGLPVIDVAGAYPGVGFREANNDDFLTGRRAGEYLRGLGFKRFAFCGVKGTAWSSLRRRGFAEAVGTAPEELPRFERQLDWWKDRPLEADVFGIWLRGLGSPTALFACNDVVGLKASETCRFSRIAVPDDLAVLGVDDEDLLCELADPSLSSVRLDCEGIGMAAAELLDNVFLSASAARSVLVPPRDIVERDSTRTSAADDPLVSRAAAWIRSNAHRRVDAGDLVAAMPASRRSLETRFKQALGTTLREAITDARLDRAKRILATSDLSLDIVAESCGFGSLQRFHAAFKAREGLTPGAWRKVGRERPRPA